MSDSTPAWLKRHPLITTGSWDSTPIYRRRRGGDPLVNDDVYTDRYRPETSQTLANAGVTLAVVDFMKCFGLAAEREFAEGLRSFMKACAHLGVHVGAYVGSTIGYEVFLLEVPEAVDWLVRRGDGNFLYYVEPGNDQPFRARMYFMHPGYRQYIRKVLREAIVDFGFSEIHFDSASVMAAPEIFYHPMAVEDFRNYLRARPPAELRERLGVSVPDAIHPPRFDDDDLTFINDSLFHYWTDFRCAQLAAYFEEMHDYIRELDPEVAISVNTVGGLSLRNLEWGGVDHSRLLPLVDILWDEEDDVAGVSANGTLTSKIRSYKMVAHAGKRMLTYTAGSSSLRMPLPLAEAAAYNNQTLGQVEDPVAIAGITPDQMVYIRFFRDHFSTCFEDTAHVADIAVLHSFRTMAFNRCRPRESSLLFEQALIQGKMLFNIVFDKELSDLAKYRVLILPDQEMLDDAQIAQIEAFVRNGGGVVITEHTSLYTETRRRRPDFGLRSLMPKVPDPGGLYRGLHHEDDLFVMAIVRSRIGGGRAAYVPEVAQPDSLHEHYPLPPNWEALLEAVRWASGDDLSLRIDGPINLTCEMKVRSGGNRYLIHLLNYATANGSACGISVQFRIPPGRAISAVDQLTPDCTEPDPIDWRCEEQILIVEVPKVLTYTVLAVSLEEPEEIAS